MRKYLPYLKNKYIISSFSVLIYILLLHDADVFTLIRRNDRVTALEEEIKRKKDGIQELRSSIKELEDIRSLEKYAREEHYFKKDDEDLFIFSFE